MESVEVIREACDRVLRGVRESFISSYKTVISPSYCFVPLFVDDSEQSLLYIQNKKQMRKKYVHNNHKMTLEELVQVIYDNQDKISWVDFVFYAAYYNEYTIYIVELVCLNKIEDKLKYHASWDINPRIVRKRNLLNLFENVRTFLSNRRYKKQNKS